MIDLVGRRGHQHRHFHVQHAVATADTRVRVWVCERVGEGACIQQAGGRAYLPQPEVSSLSTTSRAPSCIEINPCTATTTGREADESEQKYWDAPHPVVRGP